MKTVKIETVKCDRCDGKGFVETCSEMCGWQKNPCPACDGNKMRHVFGYVNGKPVYVQVEDR